MRVPVFAVKSVVARRAALPQEGQLLFGYGRDRVCSGGDFGWIGLRRLHVGHLPQGVSPLALYRPRAGVTGDGGLAAIGVIFAAPPQDRATENGDADGQEGQDHRDTLLVSAGGGE